MGADSGLTIATSLFADTILPKPIFINFIFIKKPPVVKKANFIIQVEYIQFAQLKSLKLLIYLFYSLLSFNAIFDCLSMQYLILNSSLLIFSLVYDILSEKI
jgi:hypothetical protein